MAADQGRVGVIGATSIVGECLLPLLVKCGWDVVAFSRKKICADQSRQNSHIIWKSLSHADLPKPMEQQISLWISLAPITALPEYFPLLLTYGARHVVAISSTSRFTKNDSSDRAERKLAKNLADHEEYLTAWTKHEGLTYMILRTTMVYGLGRDKNVSMIANFIKRFSFFCVFGSARGLRQPVHAQDVASVCVAALNANTAVNRCYNISGGEIITYREMVTRIFSALGKSPMFIRVPLWPFRLIIPVLRIFKPFRNWSAAMVKRMNEDMIFDHTEAKQNLDFSPRKFRLDPEDLPGM